LRRHYYRQRETNVDECSVANASKKKLNKKDTK
jgi:hypothetical protein